MASIKVTALAGDLPFGATIGGITLDKLKDEEVRNEIREVFEDRGLLVFEEIQPSNAMQLALSDIFGPLQEHALKAVPRVDAASMPGVIDLDYKGNLYEVDGQTLYGFVPWHFDACYTAKLNRGGVLRGIDIPPEGGLTGFADGIQLYSAIAPALRSRFEDLKILYHASLMFLNQRFGTRRFRAKSIPDTVTAQIEQSRVEPRSVHPAIWTRRSGEKVLHVSPWQSAGIHGHEDPEGDALLEALCEEMYASMTPYWHRWKSTDMVAWDNWRFLHSVSGNDPRYPRRMQRTTIQGDYGLGRFEDESRDHVVLAMDV